MERFSKKRQAIYECLCGTRSHPTADWIYEQLRPLFPDLSLATVYRNLLQLKGAGAILSIGTVDGKERFDANTGPHSHLICRECGRVLDVDIPFLLSEDLRKQIERSTGCSISGCHTRLAGLCPDCREKTST